ncbi:MAG: hypothetical protein WD844_07115 [Thermoleophilaceae bacterium]
MSARLLLACLALVALAAGCGGGGSASASGDAALTSCASRWNSERAGVFGTHAYTEHQSQQALVTSIEFEGADACAVVFSVAEQDAEHGTVGEVATLRGWVPMQVAGGDPEALQRRGTSDANASVASDGTVELQ